MDTIESVSRVVWNSSLVRPRYLAVVIAHNLRPLVEAAGDAADYSILPVPDILFLESHLCSLHF